MRLGDVYPHASIALRFTTPWELLVAVILSAQCTDVMVNKVTEKVFKKYPLFSDYLTASQAVFEQDIKPTGFYHNKAKSILATASMLHERFADTVPRTMEELLTLPGVARKTANVVLGNAFGIVVGIAVDTHVGRLSQRLRLVDLALIGGKKGLYFTKGDRKVLDYKKDADPKKIERELMATLPKKDWFSITYRLIDHGRAICTAQRPKCAECMLRELCPASRV